MSDNLLNIHRWSDSTVVDGHLCRICFSLNDLLIPIFEGEGIKAELQKKVQKYLPVKILPSDALPTKICYSCAEILLAWDSLYNLCLKTDKILQVLLQEGRLPEAQKEIEFKNIDCVTKKFLNLRRVSKSSNIQKISTAKKLKEASIIIDNDSKMNENIEAVIIEDLEKTKVSKNSSMEQLCETEMKTLCAESLGENELAENKSCNESETQNSLPLKCELCSKSYKSKKCLNRHKKKFHEQLKRSRGQKCDLCSNVYKTKANLERHYLKEHLTDQEECPVCHESFNSKKLEVHLKSAHGVKTEGDCDEKFKCKMCDKWFKNKYVRNSHMKDVHLSEPMKCKLCDFEGVQTVLRRHKRDVHAEKKFMCSLCPSAFKTLHTLKMHMTSHSDIRCYTCDICGMGFKRLNNVRDHMKCHEEKSNQCQICGNFFARKRYLAIHEKTIHNFYADGIVPEEKGFECGTCGAKLKWKKNLLAHMRIHTGEKPYICKICNKDFICHGSLRTHMAKHSVCTLNDGDSQSQASVSVFSNINKQV